MEIIISKTAEKNLRKMDRNMRDRILDGIKKIPKGDIKKLKGFNNDYRLRIGDYRILFTKIGNVINVIGIAPRGEAYKKL